MFDGNDTTVSAVYVNPDLWPKFASRLLPNIEKMAANSGGRYDTTDILACIWQQKMQAWVAMEGASILCLMLTEIINYPQCRALRCVAIVGHRPRRWMYLLEHIEMIARTHLGCTLMEALHTPGHERLLKTGGWQPFHILSEKQL